MLLTCLANFVDDVVYSLKEMFEEICDFLMGRGSSHSPRRCRKSKRTILVLEEMEVRACPAMIAWTDLDGNHLMSDANNWSTQTVPGPMDTMVFGAQSQDNANLDAAFPNQSVGGMQITDAYAGNILLGKSITVGAFSFLGGGNQISGPGVITIPQGGRFIWNGGTLANSQVFLSGGAQGDIGTAQGGLDNTLSGCEIVDNGTLNWDGSNIVAQNGGEIDDRSVMNITTGGYTFTSDLNTNSVNLKVESGATLSLVAGNAGQDVTMQENFYNAGTVNVPDQTALQFQFLAENAGQINNGGSVTYTGIGMFDDGSSISNTNLGATTTFDAGQYVIKPNPTGPNTGATIASLVLEPDATVMGAGQLNITLQLDLRGGELENQVTDLKLNCRTVIEPGDQIAQVSGLLKNEGTMTWSSGEVDFLTGAGFINSGTLEFQNLAASVVGNGSPGQLAAAFTNSGTIKQDAGNNGTTIEIPFTNTTGTLNLLGGTMTFTTNVVQNGGQTLLNGGTFVTQGSFAINGGQLTGIGSLTAQGGVTNAGTISMGSTRGTLTINGALTQTAQGTISLEIDARNPQQIVADQLAITGAFNAAGNLNVNWVNNTPPTVPLVKLALLKYASITGMLNISKPPNSTVTTNKTETDLNYTPPV